MGAAYHEDFYLWTRDQARRLRGLAGDNRIDAAQVAEEIEDLGRSQLNAVQSHLVQLLAHLLKAAWSPNPEPQRHWRSEIRSHHLEAVNTVTPGMRQPLDMARIWRQARRLADDRLADHGEPALPRGLGCPFDLGELLDEDFDIEVARDRLRAALDAGA